MDSFVSRYPVFHALVLKPFVFGFCGSKNACIIGHISKALVVDVPDLQCAWFVSKNKLLLPIHVLGSAHTAPASCKVSNVLPICDEHGKLQLRAKN